MRTHSNVSSSCTHLPWNRSNSPGYYLLKVILILRASCISIKNPLTISHARDEVRFSLWRMKTVKTVTTLTDL
jgi:hypothetical protein